ncbi:MAG: HIT family protein [Pseudomonadota bacterium]
MTDTFYNFELDARLAADTFPLCQSDMSLLLVMRDARFPWIVLVPKRGGLFDLVDLTPTDESAVMADQRAVAERLKRETGCDKLNIASLGNKVRQLHIHIIARFENDEAWPGPVWGVGTPEPMMTLPAWAQSVRNRLVTNDWSAA